MMYLITGGSASGKSEYAESIAVRSGKRLQGPLYYIATMQPYGKEGEARVKKHRMMRAGKGFQTIECYHDLKMIDWNNRGCDEPENERTVLLECISNLLANEQFGQGGSDEAILDRILRGILHLKEHCDTLIVVTNEVFSDGVSYDQDTMRYLRLLGSVNQRLIQISDTAAEVVYGIPIRIKGCLWE